VRLPGAWLGRDPRSISNPLCVKGLFGEVWGAAGGRRWGRFCRSGPLEQPHPRRQLRRHIDDMLAGADELLGKHRPHPGCSLDGPSARLEARRPLQEPASLMPISVDTDRVEDSFGAVDRDRCVGPLVRVDPDDEHGVLPVLLVGFAATGTPDTCQCRSSYEPHRNRTPFTVTRTGRAVVGGEATVLTPGPTARASFSAVTPGAPTAVGRTAVGAEPNLARRSDPCQHPPPKKRTPTFAPVNQAGRTSRSLYYRNEVPLDGGPTRRADPPQRAGSSPHPAAASLQLQYPSVVPASPTGAAALAPEGPPLDE
jgi:hypothetical protein